MNCKPGDLAIVVTGAKSSGRIVRTIRMLQIGDTVKTQCGVVLTVCGGPQWLIDGLVFRISGDGVERIAPVICDRDLCPIRDPGDDAVDETLLRLPAPSKETA